MERGGKALPIVFLHGNGFCKEVFSRQFESADLTDHRLIALDLPGHGTSPDSDDPATDYTYKGLAAAVSANLARIGIKQCIIAGWSLGGHVALEMLEDPSVAGVLAFGTPPASNGPMGLIRAFHINRMLLLAGKSRLTEADALFFERNALGDHADGSFVETIQRTDPALRPALSRSLLIGNDVGQRDRFLQSEKPVALVNGEHDPLVRHAYVEALDAPCLYSAGALTLPDCGHAPFLELQGAFDHLLKCFADDVEAGTAMIRYPAAKSAVNA